METRHYLVYQITNLINNKIYIGIHSTENVDDGYMGSGKAIKHAIKKYGIENFEKIILFDFDNPEDMILKESQLVDRKFIARKDVYNITCGGRMPSSWDTFVTKDVDGNCFRIRNDDPRYLSGELRGFALGKATVKDIFGKIYHVNINDPRYLSGELIFINAGNVSVKDAEGNTMSVSLSDPRYLSGELVACFTGRFHTEETKQKISQANSINHFGERNSQYGTCWIHNLELKESKKIKKEDIHQWLDGGWISGRKMKF